MTQLVIYLNYKLARRQQIFKKPSEIESESFPHLTLPSQSVYSRIPDLDFFGKKISLWVCTALCW